MIDNEKFARLFKLTTKRVVWGYDNGDTAVVVTFFDAEGERVITRNETEGTWTVPVSGLKVPESKVTRYMMEYRRDPNLHPDHAASLLGIAR